MYFEVRTAPTSEKPHGAPQAAGLGRRRRRARGLALLVLAAGFPLLTSCVPADTTAPSAVAVTDDTGRAVSLPAPAGRVFSVLPSLTETVAALDPDALVARTRFDQAPELAHLPVLGGTIRPNLEALARLEPDLFISWDDPGQRTVADRVEALGIPVYRANVQTIADVRSHLRRLGVLLGRVEHAEGVVDSLDQALARVAAAVEARDPVTVYYSVWHDPPQTTGPGTFIDQVIGHAGGRNVFGDASRAWPQVSLEAIVQRDPDALVIARHSQDEAAAPWLDGPGWRELEAVRTGRYLVVDGDLFNRPGPRVATAALLLARFLHVDADTPADDDGQPRPRPGRHP